MANKPDSLAYGAFAVAEDGTLYAGNNTSVAVETAKQTALASLAAKVAGIINAVYPVGSIYMSVVSTSPATLFGGTWAQLKDRFLLGAGGAYTAGATGGESVHKLTLDEMPAHNHSYVLPGHDAGIEWYGQSGNSAGSPQVTGTNGSGLAHNNMPPYLVVYMWQRTA